MGKQMAWGSDSADKGRPLQACRPCPCGCDERTGSEGVGYLTGSDEDGNGFTIWIESEEVFNAVSAVLKAA